MLGDASRGRRAVVLSLFFVTLLARPPVMGYVELQNYTLNVCVR